MIYYCLGGYFDPEHPKDFCKTIFPDGYMEHISESRARKASSDISSCAGSALYRVDTSTGTANVIDALDSYEPYAPLEVIQEYLKEEPTGLPVK